MSTSDASSLQNVEARLATLEGTMATLPESVNAAIQSAVGPLSENVAGRITLLENGITESSQNVEKRLSALPDAAASVKAEVEPRLVALEKTVKAPPPQPTIPCSVNWGVGIALAMFGVLLGLLTALSKQVGATAALVAFLTAFVGTSLMAWFKPDQLPQGRLPTMASGVFGLGLGAVAGVLFAFCLRIHEPSVDYDAVKNAAVASSRQQVAAADALEARSKLMKHLYDQSVALDAKTDPKQEKLAELIKLANLLESKTPAASATPTAPPSPLVFQLQSEIRSPLSTAVKDLGELAKVLKDPKAATVTTTDKATLDNIVKSLETIDNKMSTIKKGTTVE